MYETKMKVSLTIFFGRLEKGNAQKHLTEKYPPVSPDDVGG